MPLDARSARRSVRLASLLLPATVLMAGGLPPGLSAAAAAQPVVRTMGLGDRPISAGRIGRSALERYGKVLGLDEAQTAAAAALHEVYADNNRAAGKAMSDQMKELEPRLRDGDMDVIEKQIPAVMEEHARKSAEFERAFLDDLKALLTPEQAQGAWPKLERLRRREQWLRTGVLSGSNVDLTTLVDGLKLPDAERGKLTDTLDQYEVDLDRVLQDVARAAEEAAPDRPNGARGAGGVMVMRFDGESMRKHLDKQREQSARVKDVNQRYARLLASMLPDELRARLDEQYKAAAFRNIYRPSAAERKLTAAEKFDDLTDAQKKRLRELGESYRRQARTANERWAAAQEQAEAEGKYTGGRMGLAISMDHDTPPQALADARSARRELDTQIAGELDSLLTDTQKARLPKPDAGRRLVGQNVDVVADAEGHHAVMVNVVGLDGEDGLEPEEGEEGVVITRQVIVTGGEPQTEPNDPGEPKKDEPKKDEPK